VDWRPPATEMRQGFLGLASFAGHGVGIRPQRGRGAAVGRDGRGKSCDAGNGHVFGLHGISLNGLIHN
jgi:hypothetical protein